MRVASEVQGSASLEQMIVELSPTRCFTNSSLVFWFFVKIFRGRHRRVSGHFCQAELWPKIMSLYPHINLWMPNPKWIVFEAHDILYNILQLSIFYAVPTAKKISDEKTYPSKLYIYQIVGGTSQPSSSTWHRFGTPAVREYFESLGLDISDPRCCKGQEWFTRYHKGPFMGNSFEVAI